MPNTEVRPAGASLHQAVSLPEGYRRPSTKQLRPAFAVRAMRALWSLLPGVATPAVDLLMTTVTAPTATDPVGFDSYMHLGFAGWSGDQFMPILVDSGNSMLVVPRWEDIAAIPNWQNLYTVLGSGIEPWGCPAHAVRGPIQIATADGQSLSIPECEFYACTGGAYRTSNFGAGCITPWSANVHSIYTTNAGGTAVLQSPLSYLANFPLAEFHFAGSTSAPGVSENSVLRLHSTAPTGFTMMDIVPASPWMALRPQSLTIGGTPTDWPGTAVESIAMLDTGGGPAYLSDPSGFVYKRQWLPSSQNPDWTNSLNPKSTACVSTLASVTIMLGDGKNSFTYTIDESLLPKSTQGLVLVMCQDNGYMFCRYGMNIGGISMLSLRMLIDFQNSQVGLASVH